MRRVCIANSLGSAHLSPQYHPKHQATEKQNRKASKPSTSSISMATLVAQKKTVAAPNNTLEDVAEEMLNGIFCHYEPPKPVKKKRRGILRAPKIFKRTNSSSTSSVEDIAPASSMASKAVRWSETVEESYPKEPAMEIHCNVAQNCVDGCVEAGLVKSESKATQVANKYSFEELRKRQEEANKKRQEGKKQTVWDSKSILADLPPPPPPPKQFLSDLCGVRVECGNVADVEESSVKEAVEIEIEEEDTPRKKKRKKKKAEQKSKQPYDDDDNSLLEESEDESPKVELKPVMRQPSSHLKSRLVSDDSWSSEVLPKASTSSAKTEAESEDHPTNKGSSKPKFFRRIWPKRRNKDKDASRKQSRGRSPVRKSETESDWDSSIPIVKAKSVGKSRTRSLSAERGTPARVGSLDSRPRQRTHSADGPRLSLDSSGMLDNNHSESTPRLHTRSQSFDENGLSKTSQKADLDPNYHPAHPLNQSVEKSGSFDKQSFITAHREAFESTEDLDEKRSFITEHREQFEETKHEVNSAETKEMVSRATVGVVKRAPEVSQPLLPTQLQQEQRWKAMGVVRDQRRTKQYRKTLKRASKRRDSRSPRRSASPHRRKSMTRMGHPIQYAHPMVATPSLYPGMYQIYATPSGQMIVTGQAAPPAPVMQLNGVKPENASADKPIGAESTGTVEAKSYTTSKQDELTWEERTRQAWERLRNGLTVSTPSVSDTEVKESDKKEETDEPTTGQNSVQLESNPGPETSQASLLQPVSPAISVSDGKRVSFGPPTQQYFFDHQDENLYYDPPVRKKKVFRGRKIIATMFGRNKKHDMPPEGKLPQSRSVDMTASNSASLSWDEGMSVDTSYSAYGQPVAMFYPVAPGAMVPGIAGPNMMPLQPNVHLQQQQYSQQYSQQNMAPNMQEPSPMQQQQQLLYQQNWLAQQAQMQRLQMQNQQPLHPSQQPQTSMPLQAQSIPQSLYATVPRPYMEA